MKMGLNEIFYLVIIMIDCILIGFYIGFWVGRK
jgi:uncharacterized protein YneF (UPF0154 family)